MLSFPTLTSQIDVSSYSKKPALDPVIKSSFEAGYTHARARFTRVPFTFSFSYSSLPESEKNQVEQLYVGTNFGVDSFLWTDPISTEEHEVRFASFEPKMSTSKLYWNVNIELTEV